MADLKISQLSAATTVSLNDVVPVVNQETTKKLSFDTIFTAGRSYYLPLSGGGTIEGNLTINGLLSTSNVGITPTDLGTVYNLKATTTRGEYENSPANSVWVFARASSTVLALFESGFSSSPRVISNIGGATLILQDNLGVQVFIPPFTNVQVFYDRSSPASPFQILMSTPRGIDISNLFYSGTKLNIETIPTGSVANTVCLGNDPRLSNNRAPIVHKINHAIGGSDPLTPTDIGAVATVEKGSANGVATLNSNGKVPDEQLPELVVAEYLGAVYSQAEMLQLIGQKGDWCIRADKETSWIISGSNPSLITSWTEIIYPPSPHVYSVNGKKGDVIITLGDLLSATALLSSTSFAGLTAARASNNLVPGVRYEIKDFQLKWWNQSANNTVILTSSVIEPLYVLALSGNKLSHEAYSSLYPEDTIYYDIDAKTSSTWGTINTDVAIPNFKGWIARRTNPRLKIDTEWDWRHITHNCCRLNTSSVSVWTAGTYNEFAVVKDNDGKLFYSKKNNNTETLENSDFWQPISDYNETLTYFATDEFSNFSTLYNNTLSSNRLSLPWSSDRIQQPTFTSSLTSIGVSSHENCKSIQIGSGYNTVFLASSAVKQTTLSERSKNNTFGALCSFNHFNNKTENNIFGNNLTNNTFSTTLSSVVNSNFSNNNCSGKAIISNSHIANSFSNNNVTESFSNNIVGSNFNHNNIIAETNNLNFVSSTHVYNTYNTTFVINSIGNLRLTYFNSNDQLLVVNPTL